VLVNKVMVQSHKQISSTKFIQSVITSFCDLHLLCIKITVSKITDIKYENFQNTNIKRLFFRFMQIIFWSV